MPPATGPEVPDLTPYLGTAAVLANLEGFRAALNQPAARLSDVARDVGIDAHHSFFTYLDQWPAAASQKLLDLLRAVIVESEQPRGIALGWINSDDGGLGEPRTMADTEVIIGDWFGDPVPVIVRSPHP
jgi:hypothetical protein